MHISRPCLLLRLLHIFAANLLFWQTFTFLSVISFPLTRRSTIKSVIATSGMSASLVTTTPESNVRWGIIGLGDVCQKKSGPAFYKCEGSNLVAVMRRTPGKAKDFAARVPGGKCVGYEDLDAFLQHPGLDAVYISTRPGDHLEICRKVATAGKACYVEKPVGRCAEETEQIVEIFAGAKLPLYTAYISRAYERTQAVRRLLKEGAIGDKLVHVSYKLVGTGGARDMDGKLPWRLDARQSGGGLIMDVGCHLLDRIDYICGPLENVKGYAENKHSPSVPVEDFVHLNGDIGKAAWAAIPNCEGASVECTWDFASTDQQSCDVFQISGSKGTLKMAGMSPAGPIEVYDAEGKLLRELQFDIPEHTAQALIQAITNDLRNKGKRDFLSYGDNSIRTQRVLDIALKSYYGGREAGYWKRRES